MLKKEQIEEMSCFNGYGGFNEKESEYSFFLNPGEFTPSPWINIVANPDFGSLITERGAMYTWFKNSYLFRLTPRIDDPLLQTSGEQLFIKEEESEDLWEPTRGHKKHPRTVTHGKGYSVFEQTKDSIETKVTILVPENMAIKFIRLEIENKGDREQSFKVGYFCQFVLGESPEKTRRFLRTVFDKKNGIIYSQNPTSQEFPSHLCYVGSNAEQNTYFNDKCDFFGKSDPESPQGIWTVKGKINSSPNHPSAAVISKVSVPPRSKESIIFYIGVSETLPDKKFLKNINDNFFLEEKNKQQEFFKSISKKIIIETPNKELNILFNQQLLYQTLACRYWAKTGFYQPGGAFGYRDQLQDAIPFLWSMPEVSREHILMAASRQFVGGGVQHWWHPPRGQGVRSLSSDAPLWLAYVSLRYLRITGDIAILNEKITYLTNRPELHCSDYFTPEHSSEGAALFEHLKAAIDRTLYLFGSHHLPLILSGDWNDGLSKVGDKKRGESTWMAMFLIKILTDFLPYVKERPDEEAATRYAKKIEELTNALEKHGWDGDWYLRGYWDSGKKLGSAKNSECKIDSLPQSWSAIATTLDPARVKKAVSAANKLLIDQGNGLIKLFDPPFSNSAEDPGYIMTYPPGVRENGGNYSHAAGWLAQANALLGDGEKAMEIVNYLNPISRTATREKAQKYKGEPYVMAADIYTSKEHLGRAGWTWYTGSAGVLYSVVLENILGIKVHGNVLKVEPALPKSWKSLGATITYKETVYSLSFENKGTKNPSTTLSLDGGPNLQAINLVNDKKEHKVRVVIN
jgi:cyclic beta-1,2-glucan synthetase